MRIAFETQSLFARANIALLRYHLVWLRSKTNFDPNQPRIPAGRPDGGQWTNIVSTLSMRRAAAIAGGGASFHVAPNPKADSGKPWYEDAGSSQVAKYNSEIVVASTLAGVDSDLVRAIMYIETTHGNYAGLGPLLDATKISKTILPMNVNVDVWGDAYGPREALEYPLTNILVGASILAGISANLPSNASIAEIATLYNNLSANHISTYGARVQAIYNQRLWESAAP